MHSSSIVMSELSNSKKKWGTNSCYGTGQGRQFYKHGLRNIGRLVDEDEVRTQTQEDSEGEEEPTKHKPKPLSHAEIYKRTLEEAKQGGQDLVPNKTQQRKAIELTAEQLEGARLALDQVCANEAQKLRLEEEERQRGRREELYLRAVLPSTLPIDINGYPNTASNPVFFQAPNTRAVTVPGIPYPVSDTMAQCGKSTAQRKRPGHRPRRLHKTDISLCRGNHKRLVLHWDISDAVNEKRTWSVKVKSYTDRFPNGAADHEKCQVYVPASRVHELAERVLSDYAEEQLEKSKEAVLDARGSELLLTGGRGVGWGSRTPFEYLGRDDWVALKQRVEREIRMLLLFL